MAKAIATNLVDAKYGRLHLNDPSESVAPGHYDLPDVDEPVFVLRAQDRLAVATLARYRNLADTIERPEDRRDEEWFAGLDGVIEEFQQWQAEHGDKVKLPD